MRRVLTVVIAAMIGLAAARVSTQVAKPNFAGSWTIPNEDFKPGDTLLMTGDMTIAQDEKTITVRFTIQPMGEIKTVYKLDGSDSSNTLNVGGGDVATISKVRWDDSKLTIRTSFSAGTQPVEFSMRWSLDALGNLVVETTRPDFQNGGSVTTTATYKKKS